MNYSLKQLIVIILILLTINAWTILTQAQTSFLKENEEIPPAVHLLEGETAPFDGNLLPIKRFNLIDNCMNKLDFCETELQLAYSPPLIKEYPFGKDLEKYIIAFLAGAATEIFLDKVVFKK